MKNRLGWYNLRPQLEPDALRDKNAFYHNLDYWDRINMMQFLIHYEQYKRYSSPPYVLSAEAARIFNQFNNRIDIANTNFIENKVRDQYEDYTVFHPLYWKIILKNKYHNNPFAAGSAKRDHNRLRDQTIANQIRRTPIGTTLNVDNIVRKLGITDADQQEWLNANPNKAAEYVNRLRAAAQQDSEDTSNPLPTDEEGNEEPEGQAEQLERIRILRELAAGAKIVKFIRDKRLTNHNQKRWLYDNHNQALELINLFNVYNLKIDNTIAESDRKEINSSIELNNFIINSKNVLFENEEYTTTSLGGRDRLINFSAEYLEGVHINARLKCKLDDANTSTNEFEIVSLNTKLTGFTTFVDWEQDDYAIFSEIGDITKIKVIADIKYGLHIKPLSISLSYEEAAEVFLKLNNKTGEAISIWGIIGN
ncbi:hypothetical protein [Tenacibaculum amylolyticum]|uniref:hypothetical protein n=1 Tax=Tenacibaculum amylolyticum TaxID=104269 RepID=UPI003896598F